MSMLNAKYLDFYRTPEKLLSVRVATEDVPNSPLNNNFHGGFSRLL